MKNIFKVMGVALLACSMIMVSCKKDDDKNNNVAEGVNVTFDGQNWTASSIQSVLYSDYGVIDIYAAQTQGSMPIFDNAWGSTEVGTVSSTADAQGGLSDGHNWVEYYEETYLQDNNGAYYGDWWAKQATTEITAIDLTALTVSAKMNGTMFSATEAFIEGIGVEGAATAPYSAECGNIKMTAN
jgi:hypothetical protein